MNDLMTKETMSSLQIAEITEKPHNDVLKAIRKMEQAWTNVCGGKFSLTSQSVDMPNGGRRKEPVYLLTKTECLYIATKFNDEARAKLVLRWKDLEEKSKPQLPATYLDALKALVASEEQKQQLTIEVETKTAQINELNTAINEMQPKVSYVDSILQCKDTVTVTAIAQDYGKSAKAFNVLLRNMKIQHKVGKQWIIYGKYLKEGYVQSETFTYTRADGTTAANLNTKWTQKGRLFLYDTLKQHGVLPLIEQVGVLNPC
mgnify:CR=1 FL=1